MRIALLILVGLLGLFFLMKACSDDCIGVRGWVENKMIDLQYNGTIVKKFNNPEDKMLPYITLDDGSSYAIFNEHYTSFEVGDYIIKEKGRIDYKWINRHNDTVVFYWQCKGIDVKIVD